MIEMNVRVETDHGILTDEPPESEWELYEQAEDELIQHIQTFMSELAKKYPTVAFAWVY